MKDKTKWRMSPDSDANFAGFLFSFLSTILVGVIYFFIISRYIQGEKSVTLPMVIFFGVLVGGLLLYSLLVWIFGRKAPGASAVFAVPVSVLFLLYAADVSRAMFSGEGFVGYYRKNSDVFGAMWPYIAGVAVLLLLGLFFYEHMILAGARNKVLGVIFCILAFIGWTGFSTFHVWTVDFPIYKNGEFTKLTLAFLVLFYVAGVFYFLAQLIVVIALKKKESLAGQFYGGGPASDSQFTRHTVEIEPAPEAVKKTWHEPEPVPMIESSFGNPAPVLDPASMAPPSQSPPLPPSGGSPTDALLQ